MLARSTSGGYQNILGFKLVIFLLINKESAIVESYCVLINECSLCINIINSFCRKARRVAKIDALYVALDILYENTPIVLYLFAGYFPAKVRCWLIVMISLGSYVHEFLRDAADVYAGAS